MKKPIAPTIYATSLHAFIEKALRSEQGIKLNSAELYISHVVLYLERFLRGGTKKLLVNLPGRHLKTFMCSVCLTAFMLGLDPTLKFLIVAYNEDLAEDIVRQIRDIMQSNWYKTIFATRLDPKHSKKRDFKVVGGGRVRASAVRSVTGKGADVIIFDDPHNADEWDNDRIKSKVIEAFQLLVSRRDGGKMSRMLVVGHRIAEDDLSAHILEGHDDFVHVRLPLYAPKDMSFDLGDASWHLTKGEALRPDAYPSDEIKALRRNHQGAPFRLYYQQGLGPKIDDFQLDVSHFPFLEWNRDTDVASGAHIVLSVDPAQKTESASRNVIHVYAVHGDRYVLLQAFAEKCSFRGLKLKVKKYAQLYGASLIIIENTARGPDLIEELRRDLSIRIVPVNPRGTKALRYRKCIPIIRANGIHIRRNRPDVEAAIDEILAYPNGAYDDHVDALTNFLLEAAKFTSSTFVNASRLQPASIAVATSSSVIPVSSAVRGIAIAHAPSILRPTPLPDFSNGRAEPDRRPDGRSHYAAEENPNPVFSFDGEKMVRLK